MSFNKIIVVGNLGRDPELRYTPQGVAVCNFSMATNEKKKDKSGELQDVTTWFRITLWRNQAENAAKYLAKGDSVYIEGRLGVEEWTDRDGNNRFTLEVQGTEMQFISTKPKDGDGASGAPAHQDEFSGAPPSAPPPTGAPATTGVPGDDDIPF